MYYLSLTEFSVHLGLYDEAFIQTPKYDGLLIEWLPGMTLESYCCWLSTTIKYDPHSARSTSLRIPSLRYIHHQLRHTLIGHGDSPSMVSLRDFPYIISMVNGFHFHLGHEVTLTMHHQAVDPRVGVIFVGLYISRPIWGMGLLARNRGMRMEDDSILITLNTLKAMRLVQPIRIAQETSSMLLVPLLPLLSLSPHCHRQPIDLPRY